MGKKSIAKKPKGVNDQQLLCAMCFIQNGMKSWTQAAKDAGYPVSSAHNRGSAISKMPAIKKLVADHMKKVIGAKGLTKERVLSQLADCMDYDPIEYVDNQGRLLVPFNKLPLNLRNAVVGLRQKTFYDEEGNIESVEDFVMWVDKTKTIKMAMDHLGLNSPQEVHHTLHISWDEGMRRTLPADRKIHDITVKIGEDLEDEIIELRDDQYTIDELMEDEE